MFENKTFENILSDMLNYVSAKDPQIDVREGSIIYTALAPIALELETAYHELSMINDESFISTASKEGLVKYGNQIGVPIHEATYGVFKGEFDVDAEVGSRFSLDDFNYAVIGKLSDPTDDNPYYLLELLCETDGSEPNAYLGDLIPITYVPNLTHAKLIEVITYGEDEEETEEYRYRIQIHSRNPRTEGNVHQYEEWLEDYDGIGEYDVLPCWNGKNTVKLRILNPENRKVTDEFLSEVQNYFDPPTSAINDDINDASYPQGRGMGDGKAPIGAVVTVETVTEVPVNIDCKLVLKDGYTEPTGVAEAVEEYLKSIAMNKKTVGYMPISAEIYNADSVEDVTSLTITVNGVVMDTETTPFIDSVTISANEVAVLDENSVWGV